MMFVECGMKVYETIGSVWVDLETLEQTNTVNIFALRLRERMERLQQKVYAIQEAIEQMNIEATTEQVRLEKWVRHIDKTLDVMERVPNNDVASRH